MASTGHDFGGEKGVHVHDGTARTGSVDNVRRGSRKASIVESIKNNYGLAEPDAVSIKLGQDDTHRTLKPRHIQLIGIGGTIGTALYVQIGRGLLNGGPASLFMAFTIWSVYSVSPAPKVLSLCVMNAN